MANYVVSDTNLTLIADAIRAKSGHNELLEWPNEYKTSIENLNPVDMCIKTATDNIVSVSDAAQYDAKNTTIKIEPVQNLHGYDHPWPGRGGENLLDPNLKFPTGTQYGLTLTSADGYTFSYTGAATSSGNIQSSRVNKADAVILPAGTYISKNGTMSLYKTDGSWLRNQYSGSVFTVDEPFYVGNFYWEIVEGRTYNVNSFLALVKGSTAPTSWSPYSNICPITGWTGAKLTRRGKNLAYVAETQIYHEQQCTRVFANGGLIITSAGGNYGRVGLAFPVKAGVQYTISLRAAANGKIIRIGLSSETGWNNTYGVVVGTYEVSSTLEMFSKTITAVSDTLYLECYAGKSGRILTIEDIQLELGTTATDYEPYQGDTYDIAFPSEADTVYGGTLDVTNGVLTVDSAYTLLNNPDKWILTSGTADLRYDVPIGDRKFYNDSYSGLMCSYVPCMYGVEPYGRWNSSNGYYFCIKSSAITLDKVKADASAGKIAIAYELATPVTYTLTPQQITLLRGNNALWADTGDVTLKYFTTAFEDLAEEIGFAEGGDY